MRHGSERHRKTFADKASAERWVLKKRLELHTHNDHDRREAMVRGFDTAHVEIPFEIAQ